MIDVKLNWWDLDKSDPTVSRWVADRYRFPWCYFDTAETVHLLTYTRGENTEVLWAGSECGVDEKTLLAGRPACLVVKRFVPTCSKCIAVFEKRGGKV